MFKKDKAYLCLSCKVQIPKKRLIKKSHKGHTVLTLWPASTELEAHKKLFKIE